MKNEHMEAIARDYSQLHIDIIASVANGTDSSQPNSPTTPATFESMVGSPNAPRSSRVRAKLHKFSFRRMFSRKQGVAQSAYGPMSPDSEQVMSPTSQDATTPSSVPPTSPFGGGAQQSDQPSKESSSKGY